MLQVGIHLDHRVVAVRKAVPKAVAVRGTETGLAVATLHRDTPERAAETLGDVSGAVGAGVVDDEHVDGRRGTPDAALLQALLDDPYYALAPPKSTGREHFRLDDLPDLAPEDLLATLTELTAITVADALAPYAPAEVVASGGGVRNPALLAALELRLPLRISDERGLPAQAKEAYLMALIGFLSWHQVPLLTGPKVLGRLSPGDAPLALPSPAAPPTGLLIRTA